ncbi:OpgC domain-containing protein [Candidatus Saccharibacteria bacterium]|nr:OpgC domain-containing protein [Candidatus Saccharibacteria bacterium]
MPEKIAQAAAKAERIIALDYLRGFFIFVIIVDHLNRWPNIYEFFTGRGALWASAAEGFFIISGFLIGYIRGHKNLRKPLREITVTLWKRAAILYLWSVLLSLLFIITIWYTNISDTLRPNMPFTPGDIWEPLKQVLLQNYAAGWSYFLKLYWIMLLIAPLAVWLFRKRQEWLVLLLSLGIWFWGQFANVDWMQWQLLFFVPAIAGFHLDTIRGWFGRLAKPTQRRLTIGIFTAFGLTLLMAAFWTLGWFFVEHQYHIMTREQYVAERFWIDAIFLRDPLTIGRILLSYLWFLGLLMLFHKLVPFIKRWLAWLLLPFGTRSLTAYILHGLVLIIVQGLVPVTDNFFFNTLLATLIVLVVWGLLRLRWVQRVIPQ